MKRYIEFDDLGTFFVIWREHTGTVTKKQTFPKAMYLADRLSKKYPGENIYVLRAQHVHNTDETKITQEKIDGREQQPERTDDERTEST